MHNTFNDVKNVDEDQMVRVPSINNSFYPFISCIKGNNLYSFNGLDESNNLSGGLVSTDSIQQTNQVYHELMKIY